MLGLCVGVRLRPCAHGSMRRGSGACSGRPEWLARHWLFACIHPEFGALRSNMPAPDPVRCDGVTAYTLLCVEPANAPGGNAPHACGLMADNTKSGRRRACQPMAAGAADETQNALAAKSLLAPFFVPAAAFYTFLRRRCVSGCELAPQARRRAWNRLKPVRLATSARRCSRLRPLRLLGGGLLADDLAARLALDARAVLNGKITKMGHQTNLGATIASCPTWAIACGTAARVLRMCALKLTTTHQRCRCRQCAAAECGASNAQ